MNIVKLNLLNPQQEIPKITYRPFKTYGSNVYLEKILSSKTQEWTDGIYELSMETHEMQRIDVGRQVQDPFLFDTEIPYTLSDVVKLSKHSKIYFSLTTQTVDTVSITFYEIDLDTREQTPILTFSFEDEELEYLGMEMLDDGYFFFRLNEYKDDDTMDFFDIVHLVDVKEKQFYRVYDPVVRMTFGEKIVFHNEKGSHMIVEESYLTEAEQFEFLTSRDLELAIEVPKDFSENFVHRNAIYLIDFDTFLSEIKAGARSLSYETLDSIYMDGLIRIIGESDDCIYYKQRVYDFVLKQHKDFMSRMMLGNEIILELNKNTLESKVIAKEHYPNNIFVNEKGSYKAVETEDTIEVVHLKSQKSILKYSKLPAFYEVEEFRDYAGNYLIIHCCAKYANDMEYIKIVDTANNNELVDVVNDYFILNDIIFTI